MQVRPKQDPAAHDACLRGVAFEWRSLASSADVPRHAAKLYAEATRIDPHFALAWARLAIGKSYMYFNFIDRTPTQLSEIKQAADTALKLQPELGEGHLAVGHCRSHCLRDFDGALREFEPDSSSLLAAKADAWLEKGKLDEAGQLLEGVTLYTADGGALRSRIKLLWFRRDFAGAIAVLEQALTEPK
ncbi:MAG: hypothetical protein WBV61_12390 [Rhodanobacteraceae bacterium]